MKLLFVIDRAHADDDPNINLVRGLLPYLSQQAQKVDAGQGEAQNGVTLFCQGAGSQGHIIQNDDAAEIRFLGHTAQKDDIDEMCFYYGRDEAVRTLYFSLGKLSPVQKMLRLARHPVNSAFGAFKVMHIDLIAGAYSKRIEQVCRTWRPDAVIAVAAPFYTAKAVAAAHIECLKIIWMLDPYGTHYLMGGKAAQKQERRCLERVHKAFVPELIYSDYQEKPNVLPMAFPGLCIPGNGQKLQGAQDGKAIGVWRGAASGDDTAQPAQEKSFPALYGKQPVQLVFVGSLYADIRNPAPLLRLVQALGGDVQLTIVGGLYGDYTAVFHDEFDAFIAESVTLAGKVDKQEAQRFLQAADVLVNIGNTVSNQLPSKIFEYFATGLPVLNLKQLSQCPADALMRRYPLAHTVDTTQPLTSQTIKDIQSFLQQNAGKRMPFAQVKALFPENTPEAVAQKLMAAARGA